MPYSVKNLLLSAISIVTGSLFVYSAYTKLIDLQGFEYTIVEYVRLPWLAAAILARFLIGLEAALGLLLIFHLYGRNKIIPKAALTLTLIFSGYLIYLGLAFGNDINCGCFGDTIWMSPASSLLKNAVIIAFLLLLIFFRNSLSFKKANWVTGALLVVISAIPFILYGLPDQKPNWLNKEKFALNLTDVYTPGKADPVPATDLRQGKHIVAFLSISCPHCRMAARKMFIMHQRNPALPFYFIIAGKKQYLTSFWKETGAESIPHTKLKAESFTDLVGYKWPVIYWLSQDTVQASTDYITLNQQEIEKWLKDRN